jgi:hypothetical protein
MKIENATRFFDFYIEKGAKKYLIEVKSFSGFIPTYLLMHLNLIAIKIKKADKNVKLILITKEKLALDDKKRSYLELWDYVLDFSSLPELKTIINN